MKPGCVPETAEDVGPRSSPLSWPRVWCGGPAEPAALPALAVEFPCHTVGESNSRGFWSGVNRKKKQDKALEGALMEAMGFSPLPARGPWCVRFTRLSPKLLDDDNLGSAFKRLRDQMSKVLGVDDRDPLVAFCVAQEKRKGEPAVRVEVWGPEALP